MNSYTEKQKKILEKMLINQIKVMMPIRIKSFQDKYLKLFTFNNEESLIEIKDKIDKNLKAIQELYDIKNYKIVLNNSRDPFKNYFSMYDIKHILNENISYTLSPDMFLKDIEKRIMNGDIISLDKKFASVMSRDYKVFVLMATDLLNVGEEDGVSPFGIESGEAVGSKESHQGLEEHDGYHQDHRIPEFEEVVRTFQKHGFVLAEADEIGDNLQIHLIGHVGTGGGDAVEDLAVVGGDLRLGHKGIGESQNDGGQKQNRHSAQKYGGGPQQDAPRRAL
jgi:hypothetical protein